MQVADVDESIGLGVKQFVVEMHGVGEDRSAVVHFTYDSAFPNAGLPQIGDRYRITWERLKK